MICEFIIDGTVFWGYCTFFLSAESLFFTKNAAGLRHNPGHPRRRRRTPAGRAPPAWSGGARGSCASRTSPKRRLKATWAPMHGPPQSFCIAPSKKHRAQRVEISGHVFLKICGHSFVQICGHVLVQICGHSFVQICGHSFVKICGHVLVQICGHVLKEMCGRRFGRFRDRRFGRFRDRRFGTFLTSLSTRFFDKVVADWSIS